MSKISLRKLKMSDKDYFAKWWRDKDLLKLTSGILEKISDKEVDTYFTPMLKSPDYHFIITTDKQPIGHISLSKRRNDWYETQIVIGEKEYWSNGYGSKAIESIIRKALKLDIEKIYLEVRSTNLRAVRAYEKCGFNKIRTIKYPKNKYLPETVRMEHNTR